MDSSSSLPGCFEWLDIEKGTSPCKLETKRAVQQQQNIISDNGRWLAFSSAYYFNLVDLESNRRIEIPYEFASIIYCFNENSNYITFQDANDRTVVCETIV